MSKTLQNTINWVLPIIHFMPLNIGTSNEPAITNANMVQQTILGPPFCWNWNRTTTTFTTTAGQQDYAKTLSDFGFIEKASITNNANGNIIDLEIKESLGLDYKAGRPDFIAAQLDDNASSVTFRVMKVPEQAYTVTVTYQKKPTLFSALSDTWSVPDEYQFIYNYGFLALALLHLDDPRLPLFNQKFMSALLGTNRGLSEMDKNIFVGNWMALTQQEVREALKTQQATQARGI